MKKKNSPPVFKEYTQGQIVLLPTDLEAQIPPKHLVRVVSTAIEKMDLSALLAQYKGGGTSSYHPKMLLKVLVYAYTQQLYSSRKIAKALRENIYFMWLSGNQQPDFRTLNRFRSEVVKHVIEDIFTSVLELLVDEGYVKLENYFLDGTKLEANANQYSWVWRKNTQRYKQKLQEKVKELILQIEQVNAAENAEYGERDLEEMGPDEPLDSRKLEQKIQELNQRLKAQQDKTQEPPSEADKPAEPAQPKEQPSKPKQKRGRRGKSGLQKAQDALKKLEDDCLPRQKKYEDQEKKLAGRNSYSKTDVDATFMRMKDDHMKNGQLKPGYNLQMGTENQFVVGFSVHQRPGDVGCLVPHLKVVKEQLGRLPKNVIADSGYGSEENYAYLNQEQVGNYVKYNTFGKEQRPRYKPNPFAADQMEYDPEQDELICPAGKRLTYRYSFHNKTDNGYQAERRCYEAEDCTGCPLKEQCTKAKGNRVVKQAFQLQAWRQQARENLTSEEGKKLRSLRGVEVESVFGRLKEDWGFRRFLLRGLAKVKTEFGLLCIAQNMAKLAVQ
ncbi:MAG: IS1182 family transposase [bacterium]